MFKKLLPIALVVILMVAGCKQKPRKRFKLAQQAQQNLQISLVQAIKNKDFAGVQAAIDRGTDVNQNTQHEQDAQHEQETLTPLQLAVREGAGLPVVELLRKKGAKITAHPSHKTLLHFAAQSKSDIASAAVAKLLIDEGVDKEARDNMGHTPLHKTAKFGNKEVAKVLIDKGADIEEKDELRRTTLHLAAIHNSAELARVLIENGADKEAEDSGGRTPLHLAAIHNSVEVARVLIEKGANEKAEDEQLHTPRYYAELNGDSNITELFHSTS